MHKSYKLFISLILIAALILGLTIYSFQQSGGSGGSSNQLNTDQMVANLPKRNLQPNDPNRVWYEVFVYSYCDSNNDGIGDLVGLTNKLDELQTLGIGGIWLMPIHPSHSYHKYDVDDYYAVDKTYGTLNDFKNLITAAHNKGIEVIIDLVLNHTGKNHAHFQEACQYLAGLDDDANPDLNVCPYVDYYNFQRSDECPPAYHQVPNTHNWYYEGKFSPDMPDLNLQNQSLRSEIKNIMAYWLDLGVRGFRIDAAKEFYSGHTSKNIEVLNWLNQTAQSLDPNCYLVAEVFDSFTTIADYYQSGIPSQFNFAFAGSDGKIAKVLNGAGKANVVESYALALQKADTLYRQNNPSYIDSPFLSNHDIGRISGFVSRDIKKIKLAAAMNIFMSGSVFVYYGEELGMVSGAVNDSSYRAPMFWNEAGNDGMTLPPPNCTLPQDNCFGSFEQQRGDQNSIYNYYRAAIATRNAYKSLACGQAKALPDLNQGCVSAVRKKYADEQAIILMNIAENAAKVDLSAYKGYNLVMALTVDGPNEAVTVGSIEGEPVADSNVLSNPDVLVLPAYSVVILVAN